MGPARALAAKLVSMMISLVCGVLTTRLVLGEAGVQHYALYTLLISLPSLLAFTDLGSGAIVVNSIATSDDPYRDETVKSHLTSVGRILLGFASGTMLVNTILLVSGLWPMLFGEAGSIPGAGLVAWVCVTVFCLGVPIGIWVRVQLGLRRNHVIILLQALISPLTLMFVWLILQIPSDSASTFLAVGSYLGSFAVTILGLILTARLTHPLISSASRELLHPRRYLGVPVMHVGWPMLAQLVSSLIAMASQRYVLAQLGSHSDVAEYGVAGQVFLALNSLVIAAGVALWPHYTNQRHRGELQRGPFGLSTLFACGIALATTGALLCNTWIFGFITDGRLVVQSTTILSFGLMIALQAALYPLGMFIMDEQGIRFQVVPALLMSGFSIVLSVLLTPRIGVLGPLLANSASVIVFQLVPFSIYIGRHRDRLLSPGSDEAVVAGGDD